VYGLASRALRGRRGLCFLTAFGSRQQALSLALPHVLIVFRGAGTRRRGRGYSADRRRDGVADTGRDFLVDRAAAAHAAAGEGNGEDRNDVARAGWHRQKVTASLFKDDGFRARPPRIVKGASLLTGPFNLYN